jgi:dihydrofolate synthase/folylpolyglutamate synthase
MRFTEAVQYLYSLGNEVLAMKLGLETVRTLADALDNPQQKFPAIHIAGTNGKGSTAAMTDAILRAAGCRTGLYTSPHLISITERFRVEGREMEQAEFARLATAVRKASEQLVRDGKLEMPPTFFEQVTMIAYLHFAECEIDLAVLEVGLGGRLDATNICLPAVTAITPVGFDHQQYLGHRLAEIAGEKAGIIKPNIPVIVAPQATEAMKTIAARAVALGAPLIQVSDQFTANTDGEFGRYRLRYDPYDALLSLSGRHQATNAMTAIHITEQLNKQGWQIEQTAVEAGLSNTVWPGRLQLVEAPGVPARLLLDGAHNSAGAQVLREFLDEHCRNIPITMIFGTLRDKPPKEMAEILFPAARKVIVTKANTPRAAEPQELAQGLALLHNDIVCAGNLLEALAEAGHTATQNELVVICGSLYLVGEALAFAGRK